MDGWIDGWCTAKGLSRGSVDLCLRFRFNRGLASHSNSLEGRMIEREREAEKRSRGSEGH